MRMAITRPVSSSFADCELTCLSRWPIDVERARLQHRAYESALESLGCELRRLPEEPGLPDSVFVEDAAVVLDEVAIVTRPGAESRRPETAGIAAALAPFRSLEHIESPGTLDGGDVLVAGREILVGASARTNTSGFARFAEIAGGLGYTCRSIPVRGCLHLKSAVTRVGETTLLLDPARVDRGLIPGFEVVEVDPAEPDAANALLFGEDVVLPLAFPGTRARLEDRGMRVVAVDVSELAKAEGGVTCCSLIFDV